MVLNLFLEAIYLYYILQLKEFQYKYVTTGDYYFFVTEKKNNYLLSLPSTAGFGKVEKTHTKLHLPKESNTLV